MTYQTKVRRDYLEGHRWPTDNVINFNESRPRKLEEKNNSRWRLFRVKFRARVNN